jgi:putative ABC transport system permease protein
VPRWDADIRQRLAAAGLDPAREAEIAQELEQHLEDRFAELRAMGCSDEEARRAALDELQDAARMRQELAQVVAPRAALPPPGTPPPHAFADWGQDIRYAVRTLWRSKGFSFVAVLTLAVGIGGAVAIFSAVYAVLYRPLPLSDADRLVVPVSVNAERDIQRGSVPFADYADWREQGDVFEAVAVFSPTQVDLAGGDAPERIAGVQVSAGYFDAVQVQPLAGRVLVPSDHDADATRVAIIGDGLWRRRFGSDPAIAGRQIRLAGTVVTIAGVVPAERMWPSDLDVWLPMRPTLFNDDVRTRRDNMIFLSVARLRQDVSLDTARTRLETIAERVARDHPSSRTGWTTRPIPLREYIVDPTLRLGMLVLLGGVGLVLVIACVNLANLLLARGADRAGEVGLRSALGASRPRLIRQLMTEALVLAAAGGAAGFAVAALLLQGLRTAAPDDLPMIDRIALDGVALAAAAALTLATALLFGLLPALATSAFAPADALRERGRTAGSGRRAGRVRDALVVAQIALAIVLLIGAGLMIRSFGHLLRVDPGVDVERLLSGRVALPGARYPDEALRAQFYERLTESLAGSPGVEAAAATSYLPAGARGFGLGRVFLLEGQPEPPATSDHPALWNVVTPEYFRTVGMRLLRGRAFTRADAESSRPVMIINLTMAKRVFGNADPIGRRMRSWRDENLLREIVGVVSDVRYDGLADDDRSLVFVPHAQNAWGSLTVVVRARGNPGALAETLRREVARLDPDVAVARIATLSSMAAASIAPQRFGALLLALFAAAAVILAGIGVYGVMSYAVAQRRQELGVRLALGASPRNLFALVVGRGLALAAIGGTVGVVAGLAASPLMQGLLSGVEPRDPATLVLVPALLAVVAVLACAVPARRAARIEPLEALRQ